MPTCFAEATNGTAMATITGVAPASMVSVRVLDCGGYPTATMVTLGPGTTHCKR